MTAVKRGFSLKRAVTGLCGVLFAVLSSAAGLAADSETIVILDASRSMWGKVAKTPKHRMVLNAFSHALERDERIIPGIGLVAYGGTSPSRCDDITVWSRPDEADRDTFLQNMKAIRPWGLTPIAGALRRAANAFSDDARSHRIVLVADGLENCAGDPCNTALELKSQRPGLIVDVIALNVPKENQDKLSCMASMTGGTFIPASSQQELNEAGETIVDLIVASSRPLSASLDDDPARAGEADALALMRGAPLPAPNPRAYVRNLVRIDPRDKPEPPVALADAQTDVEPPPAETRDVISPLQYTEPHVDSPPLRVAEATVEAPPLPEAPHAVDPNAAPTEPADEITEADPLQTASIPDAEAAEPLVEPQAVSPKPPRLPFRIASRTQEPDTPAGPGAGQKPELNIDNQATPDRQGIKLRAKLTASMRKIGKPLDWTVYRVEDADRALWKQVAAVRAPEPTFKLEPGTYLVRARYGYIAASKMVAVNEGKLTDATFVLNAGGLRVLSHLVFVDAPRGTAATHFVYSGETDENGMRQLIAKSETQGEIIRLNAGKYRVISRLGGANSVVSTDVDVSPGVLTAVEVNHKAGVLSLEIAAAAGKAEDVNLVVFDTDGRLVVRMRGGAAFAVLAPGSYTITAELDGRKSTEDVDIRIGETKNLRLTLK